MVTEGWRSDEKGFDIEGHEEAVIQFAECLKQRGAGLTPEGAIVELCKRPVDVSVSSNSPTYLLTLARLRTICLLSVGVPRNP